MSGQNRADNETPRRKRGINGIPPCGAKGSAGTAPRGGESDPSVSIQIGALVDIVLKKDQRTGQLTRGHVKRILTKSRSHPHGIKVMLQEGDQVGRVKAVILESDEVL